MIVGFFCPSKLFLPYTYAMSSKVIDDDTVFQLKILCSGPQSRKSFKNLVYVCMLTSLFLHDASEPILFKTAQNDYWRPDFLSSRSYFKKLYKYLASQIHVLFVIFFKARLWINIWGHSFKIGVGGVRYHIKINIMTSTGNRFSGWVCALFVMKGTWNKDQQFQSHSLLTLP